MKKDIKFSTRMASEDREKIRALAQKAGTGNPKLQKTISSPTRKRQRSCGRFLPSVLLGKVRAKSRGF